MRRTSRSVSSGLLAAVLLLTGCVAVGCGPSFPDPHVPEGGPPKDGVKVGKGYYVTTLPAGGTVPSDIKGRPVKPKVSPDFAQVVTSNKWWSSLIWQFQPDNPYSENMYPHPLAIHARAGGLGLSYPTKPEINHMSYMFWYDEDLVVGLKGLHSPDTRVAAYSDWTVTPEWVGDSGEKLRATSGHGMPFVYFTRQGSAPASVHIADEKADSLRIWKQDGEVVGLSVGDHHYGLFAPIGSKWERKGGDITSTLNGKDFWSVAVLPDDSEQTLALFRKHAYAFVTGSEVSWEYDEPAAKVRTTFKFITSQKESASGLSADPIVALYRHQWLSTKANFLDQSYVSPRGQMKLLEASQFTTELAWNGVLPILPDAAGPAADRDESDYSQGQLEYYIKRDFWAPDLFPPEWPGKDRDTYWVGKSLGRHANVLQIAKQIGYDHAHEFLLQTLKNTLEDWFDGQAPYSYYYDKTWRTMIGFPEAYFSGSQLNDHHFHWSYFIMAAASVARYDHQWAKDWGPFVDLLVHDAANWDRNETRFPFMRFMDHYEGHAEANGPQLFREGNNEEASSEDVYFSTACILWGEATGNKAIRDMGIYLYANETAAIPQYWLDVDQKVFPKDYGHPVAGMVWGAGVWYNTWWDEDPNFIHGINFVPFSGGALYHSRWAPYVRKNFDFVNNYNHGQIWTWRDFLIMYLALGDPDRAVKMYEEDPHLTFDVGSGEAMLYHWVYNLQAMGLEDTSVTADTPSYAVFKKALAGGKSARTYVAYNPTSTKDTVKFSDGTSLAVPPWGMVDKRVVAGH
ncbi:MAG TPA: glycosyl hydrolase [Polyangiaceae bacterium]|nr:glycosyl hydrolase [Polyangiaceae bacterium]